MADELALCVIEHLDELKRSETIGSGSYGVVCEVKVNGLPCIAKRLHDVLTNEQRVSQQERRAFSERFRDECILLSRLRHPNIVQFLGVHYGRDRYDLTLVMERMHMDLETALEKFPNMSLTTKLRILLDSSCGLMHLHCQIPPIVHRDFTAVNILLSPDMRAKVADLGVSKILDMNPQQLSKHTECPGTLSYMPPEALQDKPVYDVKLDVFSFGHLVLYTVNQQLPKVYELGPEGHEAVQKGTSQLAKRSTALDSMGKDHCLYQLVTDCLQDSPEKRPTIAQSNATLQDLLAQNSVEESQDCVNLEQMKQVNMELVAKQMALEKENTQLRMSEKRATMGMKGLHDNYRKIVEEHRNMSREVKTLQEQIKRLSQLSCDLAISEVRNQKLHHVIEILQERNAELQRQAEVVHIQIVQSQKQSINSLIQERSAIHDEIEKPTQSPALPLVEKKPNPVSDSASGNLMEDDYDHTEEKDMNEIQRELDDLKEAYVVLQGVLQKDHGQLSPSQSCLTLSQELQKCMMQGMDSDISQQAERVAEMSDNSRRRSTQQHVPYDPSLVCPSCTRTFRHGETQNYQLHVLECQ